MILEAQEAVTSQPQLLQLPQQQHQQQQQQQQQQPWERHRVAWNDLQNDVKSSVKRCHGCGEVIVDRELLAAGDKHWHVQCLRCDQCRLPLNNGAKCIVNEDRIFCSQDHKRLFGKRCRKCDAFISPEDFVVWTKQTDLFHVPCFSCEVCYSRIGSGQHYGQMEGRIYCKHHFESLATSGRLESPPFCIDPCSMAAPVQKIHHFNSPPSLDSTTNHGLREFDLPTNQSAGYNYAENARCRPKKKKPPSVDDSFVFVPTSDRFDEQFVYHIDDSTPVEFHLTGDEFPYSKEGKTISYINNNNNNIGNHNNSGGSSGSSNNNNSNSNNNNRQKRLRTSFKHHQLRAMKSYFAINHNPDAKALKELSQKTGLQKRVLQVWFQNARAKYRRNVTKQDQEKGEDRPPSRDDPRATDGPASVTDKSHASSDSPPCLNRSDLKDLVSPSVSDVSSSSFGNHHHHHHHSNHSNHHHLHHHHFEDDDSGSQALVDVSRGFLDP